MSVKEPKERVEFMNRAIELALENVRAGNGGPFAAVVVHTGRIVATGTNRVTSANDPTAHAEVTAIREACRVLGSFQLTGCDVYTSCEPCPMCLGALYWARPAHVFFAASREDAAAAGFDDSLIYGEIVKPPAKRILPMERVQPDGFRSPFAAWKENEKKIRY